MPFKSVIRIFGLFIMVAPVLACSPNTNTQEKIKLSEKEVLKENIQQQSWIVGRVVYNQFEGGFYGIITDKGDKLLPMNMEKKFKTENNKIAVKGKFHESLATIQQWGKPFVITEIKLLEKGDGGKHSATH